MKTLKADKSNIILWLGVAILCITPHGCRRKHPLRRQLPPLRRAQEPQSTSPATGSTPAATAQTANPAQTGVPTIKRESKLVLVDAIVTDKKGAYVRDLTQKGLQGLRG